MLRELDTKMNKPAPTTYKAGADMKTGMGVQMKYSDNTVNFPQSESAENIYLLTKEKIPTGLNAARGELSDYETEFNTYTEGDLVKLLIPDIGERYAVDQITSDGLQAGDALVVGADGIWKKAASGTKSRYIYGGIHNSDGHDLGIIIVVRDAIANA